MRAALTLALAAAVNAGCSFGVNRPPRTVSAEAAPACTDSMALPGIDLAVAGVAGLGGLAADEGGRAVLLGTGALFGLMGVLGTSWVKDCRRKQAAYQRLALGESVTAKAEPAAPAAEPETEPQLEPVPELEADPAVARTEHVTLAPSVAPRPQPCPKGGACPSGLKCDPLRHRCVADAELGTESQRCAAGDRCDAGLYCDLDRRVCLPGDLGLEGGACQAGDRCAPGLSCRSGVCVRSTPPTRTGSTRRRTAPRPPRDAAPPPADRP